MKITLSEIVNHGDFKCSKSQKQLRDTVIRVIETISGSRPNGTKEMDSFINLLAMKIIRKKYSLTQLRKLVNDWLLSKVIELKEEGEDGKEMVDVMQENGLDCNTLDGLDDMEYTTKKVCHFFSKYEI